MENTQSKKKYWSMSQHRWTYEHPKQEPGMVAHTCNHSVLEAEGGDSPQVWGQPGLHSESHICQGYTARHYLFKKKKKTWVKRSKYRNRYGMSLFIWNAQKKKSIYGESRVVIAWSWEQEQRWIVKRTGGSFRDHGNAPAWTVAMIVQHRETATTPSTVHLKGWPFESV